MAVRNRKWYMEITEILKDESAYPRDFIKIGIPERSVHSMLKALREDETIDQKKKKGKYFLPGYENGFPKRGMETAIQEKKLDLYLSWGWKFKGKLNHKIIVNYEKTLQAKYT